jgi:glycosyltransferase involved in cell wall biosynthesis
MTVLFGHPTGSPNAQHAALAHLEAGRLEAFCVSWIPSAVTLSVLRAAPGMNSLTERLARRRFVPLAKAPTVQGRWQEWSRLAARLAGGDAVRLADDANDWLMRTMRREAARPGVTALHCFEDCALWPFEAAKAMSKACIYDMPIAYFPDWQRKQAILMRRYADWLPDGAHPAVDNARLSRKRREMELADLVLAPCRFAEATIRTEFPDKPVALAPYGVDAGFWSPPPERPRREKLRFIFAGQVSLRKGIPELIAAWRKAALPDAELELVGSWHLAERARASLPANVTHRPPCAPGELRARYRAADVIVFPSHFEGFGLALIEAMACGLPALASDAGIAPELVTPPGGRVVAAGDVDALVDGLRWFADRRDDLPAMGRAARAQAQAYTWPRYRHAVSEAVAAYV